MNKAIQRQLNDRHLDLLRPVLRSESSQLKGVVDQIKAQGHISPMRKGEAKDSSSSRLWPDVMSRDLENHFPEYDRAKHKLQSEIDAQDQEFGSVLSSLQAQIKRESDLVPDWEVIAALSFVEKCLGHGEGIKLRVFDSGYSFEALGGSSSGSGGGPNPPKPSPDQVAAFRAYESLRPDAPLNSHCDSLKRRAEAINHTAEDLSIQALRLSESVVLQGTCQFIKNVD